MAANHLQHLGRRLARLEELGPGGRVLSHLRPLGIVERAGLRDDLRRHRQLAEVVHGRGKLEERELALAEAQLAADAHADRGDTLRVLPKGVVRRARILHERLQAAGMDAVAGLQEPGGVADRHVSLRSGFHR
jgi:hypothetical protein